MKLDRCETCGGFIPGQQTACPHCRSTRVRLGAAATLLASTAIGFTLMACYGGPAHPDTLTPDTDRSAMPRSHLPPDAPMPGAPDAGTGAVTK